MNVLFEGRIKPYLLMTLACGGILLQPLRAADGKDQTVAGVAPSAATAAPVPPRPTGSLIGVTLAPDGLSLAGVNVIIRSLSNPNGQQVVSDGDGEFAVKDLAAGTYQITATKEGLATPSVVTVEIAASKTANANLQLSQGSSGVLRGVVLASDGFSVAGVNVALRSVAGSVDRQLVTDPDGMFLVRDLPPGSYQIAVSKEVMPIRPS